MAKNKLRGIIARLYSIENGKKKKFAYSSTLISKGMEQTAPYVRSYTINML